MPTGRNSPVQHHDYITYVQLHDFTAPPAFHNAHNIETNEFTAGKSTARNIKCNVHEISHSPGQPTHVQHERRMTKSKLDDREHVSALIIEHECQCLPAVAGNFDEGEERFFVGTRILCKRTCDNAFKTSIMSIMTYSERGLQLKHL